MKIDELLNGVRDAATIKRVFGEPYEHDGATVIPVAHVSGGGGGGGGQDPEGGGGEGGGFALQDRPVGVYVIRDGRVEWHPAIDINRLVSSVAAVLVSALLTLARRRRRLKK